MAALASAQWSSTDEAIMVPRPPSEPVTSGPLTASPHIDSLVPPCGACTLVQLLLFQLSDCNVVLALLLVAESLSQDGLLLDLTLQQKLNSSTHQRVNGLREEPSFLLPSIDLCLESYRTGPSSLYLNLFSPLRRDSKIRRRISPRHRLIMHAHNRS